MKFRNVPVPEGINVSRHRPLVDLALLSVGIFVLLAVGAAALIWLGGWLARYTPVSWEAALADQVLGADSADASTADREITVALQSLVDRLAASEALSGDLPVVMHYADTDTVNAFATLGGHVFVFRGLLERMPSENALAMVLAHEIGHVVHRDVAASLGGAILLQTALAIAFGAGADSLETLVRAPGSLLFAGFSREAERAADTAAVQALAETYGHVAGATQLFEVFRDADADAGGREPPLLLSTHPLTEDRIAAVLATARANGWSMDGPLTPLPASLEIAKDKPEFPTAPPPRADSGEPKAQPQ